MKPSAPLRHAALSGACALAFGLIVLGLAPQAYRPVPGFAVFGWALAAVSGAACGARLVSLHGTEGAGFLVALGTCTLARLFAFAGGLGWAWSRGTGEALAFLVGLVAGYLPTQLFEVIWFSRQTKRHGARDAELRGTERR